MLLKGFFPILFKEKLCIFQSSAKHAFIAVLHDVKVLAPAVAHRDEQRHQCAVETFDGKISLMIAHRSDHRFRRQLQIFLFDCARQRRRIFDQI